jgi:hypothetical protein
LASVTREEVDVDDDDDDGDDDDDAMAETCEGVTKLEGPDRLQF